MKKNILLIASGLFLMNNSVNAQCTITIADTVFCPTDSPVTLGTIGNGFGTFTGTGVSGTTFDPSIAGTGNHTISYSEVDSNAYIIDQTGTYAPISGSGTTVTLGDDQYSSALPIGFTFNFFGIDYTQFYISSNGFLGFTASQSSGCCSGKTIPTANGGENNLIAFSWDDMYPPGNGSIQYFVTGVAPNQALVVNFYDIPFCCGSTPAVKTQIVMYETSNIIEIHTEYANGVSPGTMGIENIDGSIGYAVPGRNSAAWPNLVNDYVAFIPDTCTAIQNVEVLAAPNVVASVDIDSVCAGVGTQVTFTGSGADSTFIWNNGVMDGVAMTPTLTNTYTVTGYDSTGCYSIDSVTVTVNPNPTVTLSSTDELFGSDGTATAVASGNGAFTYDWDNDGVGDFDDLDSIGGLTSGLYNVTVMDVNGCIVSDSVLVGSQLGIENINEIEFSIYPNPNSGVFQINLNSNDINKNLKFEVLNSIGQVVASDKISSSTVNVNIKGNDAGVYFVRIISINGSTVKSIVLE